MEKVTEFLSGMDTTLRDLLLMIIGVILIEKVLTFIFRHLKSRNHRTQTFFTLIASILKYVAAVVIFCWGLSILKVDINTIVTSVGILTLALSFGAESMIADVVTGFFILFENQYNVGDIIEVGDFRGTVKSIGIRTTAIEDSGRNIKIINNSDIRDILNRSDEYSKAVCDFPLSYTDDFEQIEAQIPAVLEKLYHDHKDVFVKKPEYAGVQELDKNAVFIRITADVEEKNIYTGTRILNRDLMLAFRKLGVKNPYMD